MAPAICFLGGLQLMKKLPTYVAICALGFFGATLIAACGTTNKEETTRTTTYVPVNPPEQVVVNPPPHVVVNPAPVVVEQPPQPQTATSSSTTVEKRSSSSNEEYAPNASSAESSSSYHSESTTVEPQ
jgi:hypothetical protein